MINLHVGLLLLLTRPILNDHDVLDRLMLMRLVIFRITQMFIQGASLFIIILFALSMSMSFVNNHGLVLTYCSDISLGLLHRELLLIDQVLYRFPHFYLMLTAYTN